MNINDYLITQAGNDWSRLLAEWVPPLPGRFHVWLVNRLGEVFCVTESGTILRLDVGAGTCEEVARDQRQFASRLDTAPIADQWLRIGVVDACRRAGMQLGPSQCYGFKIAPILGGKYEASNLIPTELANHFSYLAYLRRQTEIYWIPP